MIPVYHPYILELLDRVHEQPGIGTMRLCAIYSVAETDPCPGMDKTKRRCLSMLRKDGFIDAVVDKKGHCHYHISEKGDELRTHLWAIRYLAMGEGE